MRQADLFGPYIMTRYVYGERIAKTAQLGIGCCAVVYDESRTRILLLRRRDNKRWTLPGGMMESGETPSEACLRELKEECGVDAEIARLIGVYSSPDRVTEFPDGNRFQFVNLVFECIASNGTLTDSAETYDGGYFTRREILSMDVLDPIRDWISDAFEVAQDVFIR